MVARHVSAFCAAALFVMNFSIDTVRGQLLDPPLIAAFQPILTGDPDVDFSIGLSNRESFMVYLIVGVEPTDIRGFEVGFLSDSPVTLLLRDVWTAGGASFFQNSIGTISVIEANVEGVCVELTKGDVLAEIEFSYHGQQPAEVQLIGGDFGQELEGFASYRDCSGVSGEWSLERAPLLKLVSDAGVALGESSWAGLKSLFENP